MKNGGKKAKENFDCHQLQYLANMEMEKFENGKSECVIYMKE